MHSKITRNLPPWVRSCNRFAAAVYYTAMYIITSARHNNGATYGISGCLWNRRAGSRIYRFSGKAVAFRDVAAFRSRSCVCDKLSTLYCMLVKNTFFLIFKVGPFVRVLLESRTACTPGKKSLGFRLSRCCVSLRMKVSFFSRYRTIIIMEYNCVLCVLWYAYMYTFQIETWAAATRSEPGCTKFSICTRCSRITNIRPIVPL